MIMELDANGIADAVKQGWAMVSTAVAIFGFIFYWYFRAQKAERKASELRKAAAFDGLVSAVNTNTSVVESLKTEMQKQTLEQHKTNVAIEAMQKDISELDKRVLNLERGK